MAVPSELSINAIVSYMLENGGKVTNHDLVKHFKRFLTDPETRVQARNDFKEYVNAVATIKNEGEKCLVLKRKYRQHAVGGFPSVPVSPVSDFEPMTPTSPTTSLLPHFGVGPPSSPLTYPSFSGSEESLGAVSPSRLPPPYRPPPDPNSSSPRSPNNLRNEAMSGVVESTYLGDQGGGGQSPPPPVPPRRKSSDKIKMDNNKENVPDAGKRPRTIGAEAANKVDGVDTPEGIESEQKVSVKEQMQKFNRLASENELSRALQHSSAARKRGEKGLEDDDTASVTSLDQKSREWLVCSSQANYQVLAKLAAEEPRLAKFRDPTNGYTALHWAAKHGSESVVKLIAGVYHANVNARTNGGYTPLHIAMMFGHEDIFNLLVKVYAADPNLRDWSGRKPRQYLTSQDMAVSADTFRKIKARKKQAEKDLGFLRIGSLNMRVKKTTEAFSNFLGVGTPSSDKLHKTWGSADNIQQVEQVMQPPKFAPVKRRRPKRPQDIAVSHSTPSTPPSQTRSSIVGSVADSDSDNACGFDSNWKGTV